MKKKYTVEEIVGYLKNKEDSIETKLLEKSLIRELYKQLGEPKEEDFPEEYEIAGRGWKKVEGYTNTIFTTTERYMKYRNSETTNWEIQRPSPTKVNIVEKYTRAGWHCTVQPYNVICVKYVKHPKHEDIAVRFYSSRDCNKYEYQIIEEE